MGFCAEMPSDRPEQIMNLKRTILRGASRLSVAQPLFRMYDEFGGMREFPVSENVRKYQLSNEDRLGYVYIPLLPGYASWGYIAGILGHAFRVRGYEPILLLCGDQLNPCPATTVDNSSKVVRERCVYYGRKTARKFDIETKLLSDLISTEKMPDFNPEKEVTFEGIDIATPALASTRKYLKKYHIDLEDEYEKSVYKSLLRTGAKLTLGSQRILDAYDVEITLVYEPYYTHGYIPLSLAHKKGISARSVGMGYRTQSLIFGNKENRSPLQQFTDKNTLQRELEGSLTKREKTRIKEIMTDRESGKGVPHHFTSTKSKSLENQPTESPVVGMFTNLIWDASLEPDHGAFSDVFEWIRSTIDFYIRNNNTSLVLKTHPAEAARGTKENVEEWVQSKYGDLPRNITLLSSETDVNTYEMFDELDAGVVFNSTVGLEMAFKGLPVVVGGDTHYRGIGATIDPETPEDYESVLARIDTIENTKELQENAIKYAHFLMVKKHIDFPFYEADTKSVDYKFLPIEHEDVKPGTEPFDSVIEALVNDKPVYT